MDTTQTKQLVSERTNGGCVTCTYKGGSESGGSGGGDGGGGGGGGGCCRDEKEGKKERSINGE